MIHWEKYHQISRCRIRQGLHAPSELEKSKMLLQRWLNTTKSLPAVEWRPEELFIRNLITPAMWGLLRNLRFLVAVWSSGESVPFPIGEQSRTKRVITEVSAGKEGHVHGTITSQLRIF